MAKIPLREMPELARKAFALHEAGETVKMISVRLSVSKGNAVNLIGYGRRLAAGQAAPDQWPDPKLRR